jgi:hypothetical protein
MKWKPDAIWQNLLRIAMAQEGLICQRQGWWYAFNASVSLNASLPMNQWVLLQLHENYSLHTLINSYTLKHFQFKERVFSLRENFVLEMLQEACVLLDCAVRRVGFYLALALLKGLHSIALHAAASEGLSKIRKESGDSAALIYRNLRTQERTDWVDI